MIKLWPTGKSPLRLTAGQANFYNFPWQFPDAIDRQSVSKKLVDQP